MSQEQAMPIESLVRDSEKVLCVFGYWPSFHDAEVVDFRWSRSHVEPEKRSPQFRILTLDLHHWELTNEVDPAGYLVLRHHTRTILTFRDVMSMRLNGFDDQPVILSLDIQQLQREKGPSPYLSVEIEGADEFRAAFTCLSAEVASSIPWSATGEPIG